MSHPTPTADHELPELELVPGDLEPLPPQNKPFPPKFKLPEINLQLLKTLFRPMMFGAVGIHALLLFTPLKMTQQSKPKETAEPVKLQRLSDKVLVKSTPKVKVTAAAPKKPDLPKVAVAASNPIVVKSSEPEEKKVEEKKTEEKKTEEKKTENKKTENNKADGQENNKGVDASTVSKDKATTDPNAASQLAKESQEFADIIVGLSKLSNGTDEDKQKKKIDPYLLPEPTSIFPDPNKPDEVVSGIEGDSWISNRDVEDVVKELAPQFSGGFKKTGTYGGGDVYEAKIGKSTRFLTVFKVTSGSGVMVFQWAKSPI